MSRFDATRDRVEAYFDRTATRTWERLTSDEKVSRIRETVRAGRDRMRALILSRLPEDLSGARVLDAGCGAGQLSAELARRGAEVDAVDISPKLLAIAEARMPEALKGRVTFRAGDMCDPALGSFDHVVAMDSLIYYAAPDLGRALVAFAARTEGHVVFTVAPRTPLLSVMWSAGRLFPRADRAPLMVPQTLRGVARAVGAAGSGREVAKAGRINSGFYIADCLEMRG
ncbi:magnesium protoporphyrin IX methyltransferase [Palleronia aestuarii]|uniref:magnesium protoporphyrin IX methyltransferase n=1 Tax=Palleronia aestuarii TaxID=568105 RepID=UPI001F2175E1|nr:magnesium protoporphyrin IX methyltransferase [Palleronia aestuarii]